MPALVFVLLRKDEFRKPLPTSWHLIEVLLTCSVHTFWLLTSCGTEPFQRWRGSRQGPQLLCRRYDLLRHVTPFHTSSATHHHYHASFRHDATMTADDAMQMLPGDPETTVTPTRSTPCRLASPSTPKPTSSRSCTSNIDTRTRFARLLSLTTKAASQHYE